MEPIKLSKRNFANWLSENDVDDVCVCHQIPLSTENETEFEAKQLFSAGLYQASSASIVTIDHSRHGLVQIPSFVQEPPSHVTFSNNTGAQVSCVAHGNPFPLTTWLTKDGAIVNSVPGLRFVK